MPQRLHVSPWLKPLFSQPATAPNVTLSPADFERDFDGAIKKTLKQEQLDAKQ